MRKTIERICWVIAAAALFIYGLSIGEAGLYQIYYDWQFAETLQTPPPIITAGPAPAVLHKAKASEGEPLARLEIPSIKLHTIVAEGVGNDTLRRAIGHVPGTALPGSRGNVGLAAHRDTFFRHLGEVKRSDLISITSAAGSFDYVVESTTIVDPDEAVVLRDIGRPTLTLVTCYPFYYVGPAPKRFVVHAALMEH
jgi:sortase A